jgi:FemAB-related protein (PEP-CTERM system-associated)
MGLAHGAIGALATPGHGGQGPPRAGAPATASVSVAAECPPDIAPWDAFVDRTPTACLYHLHAWGDVIAETFGHRPIRLTARSGASELVGVLPLVQLNSRVFGRMLVSLPYFNYGGICSASDHVRDALFEAAIDVARRGRCDFLEVRTDGDWHRDLPCKTAKVAMRLDLPASPDELWKGLGSKLRSQVQRPRKEGMTALVGREELLDDFYSVFSVNMRDLGTPVYPRALFRNILRRFPDRTWIAAVYLNGAPVAAGFLAGFRERLEIPWASSLRSYNRLGPNMLLYWTCLQFACRSGYAVFDFGRSTRGEGTYRFKEQWGARPYPLYWYYWLRNGSDVPQVNPSNPRYRAAVETWKRLPLGLTRWLGPRIVRNIP